MFSHNVHLQICLNLGSLILLVLLIFSCSSRERVGDRHSKDYCAMYGICGERSDGKILNCPYGFPSVEVCCNCQQDYYKLQASYLHGLYLQSDLWKSFLYVNFLQPDELFSAKIQSLCPTITGNVCCTEAQFDTLRAQVQQVSFPIRFNFSE